MSKISRKELRSIISETLVKEGFSHSGPDPAYALSPAEIMRMRDAGIDVANKDNQSPEAQPYLDTPPTKLTVGDRSEVYDSPDETDDTMALRMMGDTPYGIDDSGDIMDRGTDIMSSMEALRDALKSGADLGPDDRDALLGVVNAVLNKR